MAIHMEYKIGLQIDKKQFDPKAEYIIWNIRLVPSEQQVNFYLKDVIINEEV